jgi:hypothetical protein
VMSGVLDRQTALFWRNRAVERHFRKSSQKKSGKTGKKVPENVSEMHCGFEFAKPNLKSPFKKPVRATSGSIMLGKRFDGRKVTGGQRSRATRVAADVACTNVVWERVPRPGIEGQTGVE